MRTTQRAEIAVTLTIISLSTLLLGTYLGTKTSINQTLRNYFSRASTCEPFKSTLVIKREDGSPIDESEIFEISSTNDLVPRYNFRDTIPNTSSVRMNGQLKTTYTFTPPEDQRNKYYQISINKDGTPVLGTSFCKNKKDGGKHTGPCATHITKAGVIKGIQVQCGGDIEYGWVLPAETEGVGDVEVTTYLIGGTTAPRDADSICDPRILKTAVGDKRDITISGRSVTTLEQEMDISLSKNSIEKELTKQRFTSKLTFSSLASGTYQLAANRLTKELVSVCKKNASVTVSADTTSQAALIYWIDPSRSCQKTTTCSQCKALTTGNKIHECKATIHADELLCCPGEALNPSATKSPTPRISPTKKPSPTQRPSKTPTRTPTRQPSPTKTAVRPSPTSEPQPPISCTRIRGNGDNAIRIMYIPIGFDDQKTFEGFVKLATESLSKTNLPAEVINGIDHVYASVDMALKAGCKKLYTTDVRGNEWASHVCEDEASVLKACRHTHRVFIFPEETARYARSYSNYGTLAYLSTFDLQVTTNTAAHEFGHAIVSLLDEYLDPNLPGTESRNDRFVEKSANCAVTRSKCDTWGEGCFEGCFYRSYYYRPSLNSVMNYHYSSTYWNKPSIEGWRSLLNRAGRSMPFSSVEGSSKPENLVTLRIVSNPPKISLEGYSKGYAHFPRILTDSTIDVRPLTVKLRSQDTTIWQTDVPTQAYQTEISIGYKKIQEQSLSLPLLEKATTIQLLQNDKIVSEIAIDPAVTTVGDAHFCGDGTYDLSSQECKTDIQIQKEYKSYEVFRLADGNNDGEVNVLDLTTIQKSYGQVEQGEGLISDINKDSVVNVLDYEKAMQLLETTLPTRSVLRK